MTDFQISSANVGVERLDHHEDGGPDECALPSAGRVGLASRRRYRAAQSRSEVEDVSPPSRMSRTSAGARAGEMGLPDALEITVSRSLDRLFEPGGEWDQLLAQSSSDTIFLTAEWLRAWSETLGRDARLVVPQVRVGGRLVAAAAFQETAGVVEFAGRDRADYGDFALAADMDEGMLQRAVALLLGAARDVVEDFRHFYLSRIPSESKALRYLRKPDGPFHTTTCSADVAPTMEMRAASEKLKKKSLRRHERSLQRHGRVDCETFARASDILPLLDEFFRQHIRRWEAIGFSSLFLNGENCEFYRRLTHYLDATGWLRFTVLRLDGQIVAAHFGFSHGGRFTWYKPTFDPDFARLSPGEVLLKRLIEQAQKDGAEEFDFTIGDEAFKSRFATKVREVVYVHVTDSRRAAGFKRVRLRLSGAIEGFVGEERWLKWKRSLRSRIEALTSS